VRRDVCSSRYSFSSPENYRQKHRGGIELPYLESENSMATAIPNNNFYMRGGT
jgi:hypothetical protein